MIYSFSKYSSRLASMKPELKVALLLIEKSTDFRHRKNPVQSGYSVESSTHTSTHQLTKCNAFVENVIPYICLHGSVPNSTGIIRCQKYSIANLIIDNQLVIFRR